jgi:hypothetical protein
MVRTFEFVERRIDQLVAEAAVNPSKRLRSLIRRLATPLGGLEEWIYRLVYEAAAMPSERLHSLILRLAGYAGGDRRGGALGGLEWVDHEVGSAAQRASSDRSWAWSDVSLRLNGMEPGPRFSFH